MEQYQDITFRINSIDITLSVDLNSEDNFSLATDDDYACMYIKELILNKRIIDLNGEPITSIYRKDGKSYTLLYNAIDEDIQTSNIQAANTDANKVKWTADSVTLLITERLERDGLFTNPTCRKKKIWDLIGTTITEATGVDVTGQDCNNKYRHLLQTYKANKKKSVQSGEEVVTWEYYKLFDDVLGSKASTLPAQNMLGSSLDIENEESDASMGDLGRKDGDSFTLLYNNIDENLQTSSLQVATNIDANKAKWTVNSVKLLITERLERDDLFTRPKCKKQQIWDVIGRIITETTGIDVTGQDCDNKYRHLLQTYKANKKKSVQTGVEAITWEYYKLFDEVLGTKTSTLPGQLGDSLKIEHEDVDATMEEDGLFRSNTHLSTRKRKAQEMKFEQYLFMKHRDAKETFKRKERLKLREIDAINNVAEAIRSLARNKK